MSKLVERYKELIGEPIDIILVLIKKRSINCGQYANLVKIDKKSKINRKELFGCGGKNDD